MDMNPPIVAALGSTAQAEFVGLASSLSTDKWSAPSLCAGMSVRDIVVHIPAATAMDLMRARSWWLAVRMVCAGIA